MRAGDSEYLSSGRLKIEAALFPRLELLDAESADSLGEGFWIVGLQFQPDRLLLFGRGEHRVCIDDGEEESPSESEEVQLVGTLGHLAAQHLLIELTDAG